MNWIVLTPRNAMEWSEPEPRCGLRWDAMWWIGAEGRLALNCAGAEKWSGLTCHAVEPRVEAA